MDRRVLEYFLAVCDARSITRAAERLFISRQALSLAIAGAERELGANLFERSKRGVELTWQGEMLYRYATAEAKLWQELQSGLHGEPERTIRVGSVYNRLERGMVERIMDYGRLNPAAKVGFISSGSTRLLWEMLAKGDVEVGVSGIAPDVPEFEVVKTRDCTMYLLMSDANPLAGRDRVGFFSDLGGMTILIAAVESFEALRDAAESAGASMVGVPTNLPNVYGALRDDCVYPVYDFEVDDLLRPGYVCLPVFDYPIRLARYVVWRRNAEASVVSFARYIAETD